MFVLDWEWILAIVIVADRLCLVTRTLGRRGEPIAVVPNRDFTAGLVLIAVALLSPIEHLALTSMVSFHLLQNVIIADWAPPLLVLGLTPAMFAMAERHTPIRTRPTRSSPSLLARRLVWPAPARVLRLRAATRLGARHRARDLHPRRARVLVGGAVAGTDAPARAARLPRDRLLRGGAALARARARPVADLRLLRAHRPSCGGCRRSTTRRSGRSRWRSSRPRSCSSPAGCARPR